MQNKINITFVFSPPLFGYIPTINGHTSIPNNLRCWPFFFCFVGVAPYVEAVQRSKKNCWNELVQSVVCDPWGNPYKLVMRKLKEAPATDRMEATTLETVTKGLFPDNSALVLDLVMRPHNDDHPEFTLEEIRLEVAWVKGRKKAPG